MPPERIFHDQHFLADIGQIKDLGAVFLLPHSAVRKRDAQLAALGPLGRSNNASYIVRITAA